ncbi:MAG: MFS transporter [Sphingobium sp.]
MRGRVSWLAVLSGLAVLLWLALAWSVEIEAFASRSLGAFLFRRQDVPALALGGGALMLLGLFVGKARPSSWCWAGEAGIMLPLILIFAAVAWVGRYWLFGDYALSRDEQVAEFAAAALRHGWLGWPIPPEWIDYRRAIMPEFFSPFGADHVWTAAYLPLNAAFRAFWGMVGDPNLAGPVFLLIGLVSLWRIALHLFPDRPDAVAVTMLMALSSTQLLVTGMTPYAMTGHFALNMLWLALVLRGGAWGHGGAGLVALLLAGLHQYHYPLPFLAPFLLWFALGRRWGALFFHGLVLAVAVALWAKLWPHLLIDLYGPAADVRPSAGVADKMDSLVDRVLEKWHPLLHLSRFLAWNNLLLVPLALVGLWRMDWRRALRGEMVALPLALGAFGMAILSIDQGYGWGYRYLHAYIGGLALIAGYGWTRLHRPGGEARGGLAGASVLVALLTGSFLMARAHDYVAPYAAAHRLILSSAADVVLVDPRGGRYVTDLVRGRDGAPVGKPVVMNIGMLDRERIDRLCDRGTIAIFDRSAFLPLGVGAVNWGNAHVAALRAYMVERGCGEVIAPQRKE